jgi:hypothetical protein
MTVIALRSKQEEIEVGTTVGDAKRLVKKAARVFIHFHVEPDSWKTNCIGLKPQSFLNALAGNLDTEPMPCRLYRPGASGEMWLQIG